MVGWKFWTKRFWKKRTEADIQKARLLEQANQSLSFGLNFLKLNAHLMYRDPDLYPQFLRFIEDAKKHLDDAGDAALTRSIDKIITALKDTLGKSVLNALEGRPRSLTFDEIKDSSRQTITNIINLQDSIQKEISGL